MLRKVERDITATGVPGPLLADGMMLNMLDPVLGCGVAYVKETGPRAYVKLWCCVYNKLVKF